ncbi:hypothetical protein SUGI_0894200 [Cryptomeria japonica]|nr:hypothetical protein SUGI_0894200 [Cryptomeria japonica]
MDPILKVEALRYGEFIRVCYNAFNGERSSKYYSTCRYSRRELLEKIGMSQCGYRTTKYIYVDTEVLGSSFCQKSEERAIWLGFVAVCDNAKEIKRLGRRDIVVAWRGTQTTQEWIQDLKDVRVPARLSYECQRTTKDRHSSLPSANDGVRIEKGFLNFYTSTMHEEEDCGGKRVTMSARDLVIAEIKRLLQVYKNEMENLSITFTGHSLGAALATLSAYDTKGLLRANHFIDIHVKVFSFASPRVGNLAFARKVEEIGLKVLRFVNKWDVVPEVPGVFMNERMG